MLAFWHSLYFRSEAQADVAAALYRSFELAGYQRYDPFPGGIGTPSGLTSFIKLFVAPVQSGWVRVIGKSELTLLPELGSSDSVLHAWLDETDTGIPVLNDDVVHL